MNRVSPKKLLHSKWTAVEPRNREKHFLVTRVITDGAQQFDIVPAGYGGPLYLEVSPRTFPIVARTGSRLSQIRFRTGDSILERAQLLALHEAETLVAAEVPNIDARGIAMSIDLSGDGSDDGLVAETDAEYR